MADRQESDAAASSLPPEWLANEWSSLCEILGTSDPKEVVPRVQTLKKNMDRIDEESARPQESFVTISEVEEVFREMHERLQKLRDRNAQLVDQLEGQGEDGVETAFKELHRETEELLEALGVTSVEEGVQRARGMNRQLENLYHEKETLVEAGFNEAADALDEIKVLQEKLDEVDSKPDTSVFHAATAIRNIIGVASIGEAEDLVQSVQDINRRLQHLLHETDAPDIATDDPENFVELLSIIEANLASLERLVDEGMGGNDATEIPQDVTDVLGIRTVDDARSLAEMVTSLGDRVQAYHEERERLSEETGLRSADGLLEMISSMEEQLVDLYEHLEASQSDDIGGILGIDTETEARELEAAVRSMGNQLKQYQAEYERVENELDVQDVDSLLDLVYSMEQQLVDLYEARDSSSSSGDGKDSSTNGQKDDASNRIGKVLGVKSVDEAEELAGLVENMTDRLEHLTEEQEKLDEAGLTAEQAVAMIDTMEEQLVDLYQDRAEGHVDADILADPTLSASGDGSVSVAKDEAEREVLDILGVGTPDEARELADLVHSMSSQLERLTQDQERLVEAGLTVDSALQMIDSMEEQLVDLYEDRDSTRKDADEHESVQSILGVRTPEDARNLADSVRDLYQEMNKLSSEQSDILNETGMSSSNDVLAMIRSMEEQLVDLYDEREHHGDASEQLDAIEEALGVRTREDAEQIAEMAREMNAEITEFEEDRKTLEQVGLASVDDAVSMITSMQEQLEELYHQRENTTLRASALDEGQDTFQQLEALYAEREKLDRELGVSTADDVIEMVEGLATQLDDLYGDRASVADVDDDVQAIIEEHTTEQDATTMLASMEQQLRDLYGEKERLFQLGFGSADEAANRIQHLEQKRSELAQASAECRQRFERLERELGVSGVEDILSLVARLESEQSSASGPGDDGDTRRTQPKDSTPPAGGPSQEQETRFFIDAAPAFVPQDVLAELESLGREQLDELDFGVVRLSETGVVQFVNEAGLALPGLKKHDNKTTILGKNFFFDLAPSTNNNLFFGRFKEGIKQGAMDARFPYTFISPGQGPKVLVVHLHSKPNSDAHWLLFRAM